MCEKPYAESETLFPEDEECDCGEGTFFFDENGTSITGPIATLPGLVAQPIGTIQPLPLYRPCSLATLNGSWLTFGILCAFSRNRFTFGGRLAFGRLLSLWGHVVRRRGLLGKDFHLELVDCFTEKRRRFLWGISEIGSG